MIPCAKLDSVSDNGRQQVLCQLRAVPALDRTRTILTPSSLESKALPLEFLLDPAKAKDFPSRVLARLIQSEAHEANPHFKDDYRQSFIALSLALKGEYLNFWDAFVATSYKMYGKHPAKLYSAILARREALFGPAGEPTLVSRPLPGISQHSPNSPNSIRKEAA
jgi:hypothetical protein